MLHIIKLKAYSSDLNMISNAMTDVNFIQKQMKFKIDNKKSKIRRIEIFITLSFILSIIFLIISTLTIRKHPTVFHVVTAISIIITCICIAEILLLIDNLKKLESYKLLNNDNIIKTFENSINIIINNKDQLKTLLNNLSVNSQDFINKFMNIIESSKLWNNIPKNFEEIFKTILNIESLLKNNDIMQFLNNIGIEKIHFLINLINNNNIKIVDLYKLINKISSVFNITNNNNMTYIINIIELFINNEFFNKLIKFEEYILLVKNIGLNFNNIDELINFINNINNYITINNKEYTIMELLEYYQNILKINLDNKEVFDQISLLLKTIPIDKIKKIIEFINNIAMSQCIDTNYIFNYYSITPRCFNPPKCKKNFIAICDEQSHHNIPTFLYVYDKMGNLILDDHNNINIECMCDLTFKMYNLNNYNCEYKQDIKYKFMYSSIDNIFNNNILSEHIDNLIDMMKKCEQISINLNMDFNQSVELFQNINKLLYLNPKIIDNLSNNIDLKISKIKNKLPQINQLDSKYKYLYLLNALII